MSGDASLVEVGVLAWCLGVAWSAWEWLEVPGSGWEWPGQGRGLGWAALLGIFFAGVWVLDQEETGG